MRYRYGKTLALATCIWFGQQSEAFAHNNDVHQRMTDFAYEVLRAMSREAAGARDGAWLNTNTHKLLQGLATTDASLVDFYRDAAINISRLQEMPSGLRATATPCTPIDPAAGPGVPPDWQIGSANLADVPMIKLRYAVTTGYLRPSTDCGIDLSWKPDGLLEDANPGIRGRRDFTGVTLGYWAQDVDNQHDDWHLMSPRLEGMKQGLATIAKFGVAGTVGLGCLLGCGLIFAPACIVACPYLSIKYGAEVGDSIADSFDFMDIKSGGFIGDFTGLGHFIDMNPPPPTALYDDRSGKLAAASGPDRKLDAFETIMVAGMNLGAVHIRYDLSNAPKKYEIILGASGQQGSDFHQNSVQRGQTEWEALTVASTQATALDNLAMYGWINYKKAPTSKEPSARARFLGYALHALGDASVPMHVVGTTGWGHRPYEDSIALKWEEILGVEFVREEDGVATTRTTNTLVSEAFIKEVVKRAAEWRLFITNWRKEHQQIDDVPVRDIVTRLAQKTYQRAMNPANRSRIFTPQNSLLYQLDDSGSKEKAIQYYEDKALFALNREFIAEGIAAKVAFLLSAMEVKG